jgi:electron transfer flavoprotein beta subunit
MHVVVCVKQIPDPAAPAALDDQFHLVRSGKLLLDEADTYGVEVALQLVEAAAGGEVTIVSMGEASDVTGIRKALAMGATSAVVVSDPVLRGADALTTAKVLAAVIAPLNADVVLCATESSDGYTGTMPTQLAELLSWPALTYATSVQVADGLIRIHRQTDGGYDEVVAATPSVVTVTAGSVAPRYENFKGIMAAKSKTIDIRSVNDLGLGAEVVTAQRVIAAHNAPSRTAGTKVVDDGTSADVLVAFLESIKVL